MTSLFKEKVMVDLFDSVRRYSRYPDAVFEHEFSQALSVNEHDFDSESVCIVDRISREA
jgi:hypothetical protein